MIVPVVHVLEQHGVHISLGQLYKPSALSTCLSEQQAAQSPTHMPLPNMNERDLHSRSGGRAVSAHAQSKLDTA